MGVEEDSLPVLDGLRAVTIRIQSSLTAPPQSRNRRERERLDCIAESVRWLSVRKPLEYPDMVN